MRRTAPSADRNKGPILDVLKRVLPVRGSVLEIASGTGQHTAHFAGSLPSIEWQPTEYEAGLLPSIESWCEGLANVRAPVVLDAGRMPWPIEHADAILCINMIHIAPWQATLDLMKGASGVLKDGGVLFLYGPYRRFGAHTAPSNAAFDEDLRARNAEWGVRDMEAVKDIARRHGFSLDDVVAMPANNFSLIFGKD